MLAAPRRFGANAVVRLGNPQTHFRQEFGRAETARYFGQGFGDDLRGYVARLVPARAAGHRPEPEVRRFDEFVLVAGAYSADMGGCAGAEARGTGTPSRNRQSAR